MRARRVQARRVICRIQESVFETLGDVLANLALSLRSSRIVNLVVAVLMVLGGISQFFPIHLYVSLSRRKVCWVGECGWVLIGFCVIQPVCNHWRLRHHLWRW
jgi:hypothetical protein